MKRSEKIQTFDAGAGASAVKVPRKARSQGAAAAPSGVIELHLEDITKAEVDAIVNAANSDLRHTGGLAKVIARAAGTALLIESMRAPFVPTGEVVETTGGDLPARYVIHAAGPIWHGGQEGEARLLESVYRNALRLASELDCRSIAFPSISTGIYRYPVRLAAPIALKAVADEWARHPDITHVRFCLFSDDDLAAYEQASARLN